MKVGVFIFLFSVLFFLFPTLVFADAQHVTVIINQIRGTECCGVGSLHNFEQQVQMLSSHQLHGTFALRFDALQNPPFNATAKLALQQGNELGGLLEITPQLASASGVAYRGTPDKWYEAQNAFLIGYTPAERLKLIDTYMHQFQVDFGITPTTTVAWMIDPVSLQYLKQKYGVTVHELTREQWGTDSYTLYGGPPNNPYIPSDNWALVPAASDSGKMPLIVRQTITDPVQTYGDPTSTYTSQPNDYERRGVGLEYFTHLFTQAQTQPFGNTFALVGLENSMEQTYQDSFGKQLSFIAQWQKNNPDDMVMTAKQYGQWWRTQPTEHINVYEGNDDTVGKAWWITTTRYRVRLREDNNQLYIDDIRMYDPSFTDPYIEQPAQQLGYWVVPFFLDGSRILDGDNNYGFTTSIQDNLQNRKSEYLQPSRITLVQHIQNSITLQQQNGCVVVDDGTSTNVSFCSTQFSLPSHSSWHDNNIYTKHIIQQDGSSLIWKAANDQSFMQLSAQQNGNVTTYSPQLMNNVLDEERMARYPLLFPQLSGHPLSVTQSSVYVNNTFAIAGRNPARLVLFPKDAQGYPITLDLDPTVMTDPYVPTSVYTEHTGNGMFFIDAVSAVPQKVSIHVQVGDFSQTRTVYFAPDCKHMISYCIFHPTQVWWYVRNIAQDIWRKYFDKQTQ
ncbi:hypothetical protein C5B42_02395 [Candidatus Cerribacteria bacterium 'Amazon FNV 2010 28 9']|uniref:Uncharacterized protein n=1 Tax=Candidatus Cerribacteria bacterium 'Amazon FNV 2010 28 9' TaxID=2081795 RepID=A0A317JT39_9BACT|nr:MAG: hypothetical protein C5B42_02395 [Candidatus Cerribacteria bacterium 'Amazon FNV 2010 28 9']